MKGRKKKKEKREKGIEACKQPWIMEGERAEEGRERKLIHLELPLWSRTD